MIQMFKAWPIMHPVERFGLSIGLGAAICLLINFVLALIDQVVAVPFMPPAYVYSVAGICIAGQALVLIGQRLRFRAVRTWMERNYADGFRMVRPGEDPDKLDQVRTMAGAPVMVKP